MKEDFFSIKGLYNNEKVELRINYYASNNSLYIGLTSIDSSEIRELYADVTVNFEESFLGKNQAYVKNYEIPEIEEFIKRNKLGKKIEGSYMRSGYVTVPLYEFNEQRLKELDPIGYGKYEEAFNGYNRKVSKKTR